MMAISLLRNVSNEELLERYQRAEPAAFQEFFSRHHRLVFNYLLSRVRNHAEAEEAFQQTFFRLHRYIMSYDSKQSALAWLMTIARNVAVDSCRSFSATDPLESAESVASSLDQSASHDAKETLELILKSLSPADRELLEKRVLRGVSYEDIAAAEGISVLSARKRVSRILKRLKTELALA